MLKMPLKSTQLFSNIDEPGLSWATPDFQLAFKFQLQMVGKVVARGAVS